MIGNVVHTVAYFLSGGMFATALAVATFAYWAGVDFPALALMVWGLAEIETIHLVWVGLFLFIAVLAYIVLESTIPSFVGWVYRGLCRGASGLWERVCDDLRACVPVFLALITIVVFMTAMAMFFGDMPVNMPRWVEYQVGVALTVLTVCFFLLYAQSLGAEWQIFTPVITIGDDGTKERIPALKAERDGSVAGYLADRRAGLVR